MQLKYKPTDLIFRHSESHTENSYLKLLLLKVVMQAIESRMLLSMVKRSFPRKCDTNSIVHFNYKTSFLLELI